MNKRRLGVMPCPGQTRRLEETVLGYFELKKGGRRPPLLLPGLGIFTLDEELSSKDYPQTFTAPIYFPVFRLPF